MPFCVYAENDYFHKMKTNYDEGVYINCNQSEGCVPLCIYKPKNSSYDNVGIVGFKYDNIDNEQNVWQLGFTYDNSKKYLYTSGKNIPFSKVYKGGFNPVTANKEGNYDGWSKTNLYVNMDKAFSCPQYMNVSGSGADGICFSGEATLCKEDHPDLKSTLELNYSFAEEYSSIARYVYNELKFYVDNSSGFSSNPVGTGRTSSDNDKIEFLSKYDVKEDGSSNIYYDSSKSPEENAMQNCEYINQYASSQSGIVDAYIKAKLLTNVNINKYFSNELDVALQRKADQSNAKYVDLYTHDTLEKLMISGKDENGPVYRKVGMNGDVSVFEDINNLFGYNSTIAIEYISKKCDVDLSVDIDGDGMKDSTATLYDRLNDVKRLYHANIYSDPTIDFGDKSGYDCSFLTDVADIISTGYFILEIAGLAILIVLSAFDYLKIFLNDNADELKKANSNFLKRLIIAIILFLLPAIINVVLSIFKIENFNSEAPLCIEISNK